MARLFKLTTTCNKTLPGEVNECQWGEGVSHTATGKGGLCSPGLIHAYETSPEVAILLNPIHANYQPFNLWECEGEVIEREGLLKVGCKTLTTIRQLPFTLPTPNQLTRSAIYLAKEVCKDSNWLKWADNWLNGSDRSYQTAIVASVAAAAAEDATAAAAAAAAATATYAVAAAKAATAVAAATYAVAAATAQRPLDIVSIVSKAFKEEEEYANIQTSK